MTAVKEGTQFHEELRQSVRQYVANILIPIGEN